MADIHEPRERLTPATLELHRAINSLKEELDAIDWYQQRVDASDDEELKAILGHNRDEEIEHAIMVLEWIRRHHATFDRVLRTYLFSQGDVTQIEAEEEGRAASMAEPAPSREPPRPPSIGSLRK